MLMGIAEIEPAQDCPISGLSLDSRMVESGTLFLACSGGSFHGLEFVPQAATNGAAAVVCEPNDEWSQERISALAEGLAIPAIVVPGLASRVSGLAARFYGDPSHAVDVIGVTGTNGKTSCTQFLAQALGEETPCGIIGTLGNGFAGALKAGRHTTPEPVELQATLADLRQQGAKAVALEVSSHALDQGRAAAVHIDTAVLTNLSRDHLDFHGTMADYAAAKRRLFRHPDLRCAVLNLDDPFGWELLNALPQGVQAVVYGLARPEDALPDRVAAWLWATQTNPVSEGMHIRVESSWGDGAFTSPLLGRFNVSNQLAVLAVLLERGMPMSEALKRLAAQQTVPGRMERFGGGEQPLVVVDYAHTPDAMEQAIQALRPHTEGHLICLFGCGGERDKGKRPLMGAVAARLCDAVILTDDNPRREDGDQIISDILAGTGKQEHIQVERNRANAIRQAITEARPGDLVLIGGKGHEAYQQYGELRLPFSDREQVQAVLTGEADQ
ncbi:UDP-N-acetylmuramoyl-L-alanyl-D-glutamate--2,6-diaminopimelate ligase [Pseudomonadota bacterium]